MVDDNMQMMTTWCNRFFESTVLGDPTTVGLENLVRGHGHNARDIEKLMRLMARVELV